MIRLIVRQASTIPDGVCVGNDYRTFDVSHPELERLLSSKDNAYLVSTVIGAEIIIEPDAREGR